MLIFPIKLFFPMHNMDRTEPSWATSTQSCPPADFTPQMPAPPQGSAEKTPKFPAKLLLNTQAPQSSFPPAPKNKGPP